MEAALAIAGLVSVLVLCLAGATALSMQVRCIDAAREVARLAARNGITTGVASGLAPAGAAVELRRDGGFVVARVSDRAPILPGLTITGQAIAALEPGS